MASTLLSPQQAIELTRAHWQIENALHWMLDVHLHEDLSRARKGNAPRQHRPHQPHCQKYPSGRRYRQSPHCIKKCTWNEDYLIQAIAHMRWPWALAGRSRKRSASFAETAC
ncbi:transposase [Mesorhizobium sp. WSM1293]|uniref:transposase n=1 Tax=Mesorhizobium sp. WSM1293 TaxID=1040984 RepID=UPI0009FE6EBC|nr:transposase [Mesorhizobium sp. WSM1293]